MFGLLEIFHFSKFLHVDFEDTVGNSNSTLKHLNKTPGLKFFFNETLQFFKLKHADLQHVISEFQGRF